MKAIDSRLLAAAVLALLATAGCTCGNTAATGDGGADGGGGNPDSGPAMDAGRGNDGGSCQNDPVCSAAGATCSANGGELGSCVLDAGCLQFVNATACPAHQACTGAAPNAACGCAPTACTDAGTDCAGSQLLTCARDSNGCLFVAADAGCAVPQLCVGGACACPPSGTGVNQGCAAANATECDPGTHNVDTCATLGACVVWTQTGNCTGSGLTCGTAAGAPGCQCTPNAGPNFYADALHGTAAGAAPFPTGAQSPPGCRFARLTDALTLANASLASSTVIATGADAGSPEQFAAETLPLAVGPGNALTSDDPASPGQYAVLFNSPNAPVGIALFRNTSFSGFTVRNVSGNADAGALAVLCSDGGTASLASFVVQGTDGGAVLGYGVVVLGNCATTVSGAQISQVGGGVVVESTGGATTQVSTSALNDNAIGIGHLLGTLNVSNSTVTRSSALGIAVVPDGGDAILDLSGVTVTQSGGDGLLVLAGKGATAASTATVTGSTFDDNGAAGGGGIDIQARSATLTGVRADGNHGYGLLVTGVANVTVSASAGAVTTFSSTDAGPGALCFGSAGGNGVPTLTATGATFANNDTQGVSLGGCTAVLDGVAITGNDNGGLGVPGLAMESGNCTLEGASIVQNNHSMGIREFAGSLLVDAGVEISANATDGVEVLINTARDNATLIGASVHNNGVNGMLVNNGGGGLVSVTGSSFTDNAQAGLRADRSEAAATVDSLFITGCRFGSDAGTVQQHGMEFNATPGVPPINVRASVTNNDVRGHAGTGVILNCNGTSHFNLQGNVVEDNAATDGGGRLVGGVLFTGGVPGLVFAGNVVGCNKGDQILVVPPLGAINTWPLSGSGCTPATQNVVTNYAPPFVGVEILGAIESVNAHNFSWQSPTPASGVDYSGAVNTTPFCAPTTTCP